VRADIEEALKCAPHPFSIAEAAFLGDSLDRQDRLLEFAASRIGARPLGELRRSLPSLCGLGSALK
jgi:hypothetical protein